MRGMKRTEAVAAREREEDGRAGRHDLRRKKAGLYCVESSGRYEENEGSDGIGWGNQGYRT